MQADLQSFLRLQQVADSAIPIGGAAHSFGLESLVDRGLLDAEGIEVFLADYLAEVGVLEAACSAQSCNLARGNAHDAIENWLELNIELGARKTARESRDGSASMGRRLLDLAARVSETMLLRQAAARASDTGTPVHLAASFGLVAGTIGVEPESAAAAYLQQSMTALISCCQRLLPLGQTRAHQILWNLKPAILASVHRAMRAAPANVGCFTPLLDIGSAQHPMQHTRLFMS